MKNFVEELRWRGMIHDSMPGTEEYLKNEMGVAYVGIDPTADSLHIGHLVSVMMLRHFQIAGHKPILVLGGATGMIGDPSGKSEERNLLDEPTLRHNQEAIKEQLRKFLDFDSSEPNHALMVNNFDWMKEHSFLSFIRDVGKHITVNYMMAKDSVKKRLSGEGEGMSFTEFSYQLVQGYDFLHLYQHYNCRLQMGGSDQWGNITTGTELIRRKTGGEAFALTCPLITKADGGKFGKTEKGNVWLDPAKTTPYAFLQFWLNVSDEDAEKFIRIFTFLDQPTIENIIQQHRIEPHLRLLQKTLAKEITLMVHGESNYHQSIQASEILFGKGTTEMLHQLSEELFLSVFEGVPGSEIKASDLENDIPMVEFLTDFSQALPSKSEARRMLKDNGIAINKAKVSETSVVNKSMLLNQRYILIQKGKKNYHLVRVV